MLTRFNKTYKGFYRLLLNSPEIHGLKVASEDGGMMYAY